MTIFLEKFIEHCDSYLTTPPKVIFEIGAREGEDSVRMKGIYPSAKVFAFEAHLPLQLTKKPLFLHSLDFYLGNFFCHDAL